MVSAIGGRGIRELMLPVPTLRPLGEASIQPTILPARLLLINRTKPPPPPDSVRHQWDQFLFTHATLPYSNSSDEFGSLWQASLPCCSLQNFDY